jgi:dTDP-4-amino-4,6-dideoxygalactose transaminase
MHPIAFIDLSRQQERIRGALDAAIRRVLDHGQYIMGPEVEELERRLANFCGARNAIACANGTDALLLALIAKDLRAGDAVIMPSFTFCATAEPVSLLGGVPIFADVLEDTFNLDPDSVKAAVSTARRLGLPLRGVISVDLFGQPCDYDAIEEIVRENSLWLICDAAQAFGATYRDRKVGTIGNITTTSFFPAKPLGCYGDGGAVFTDDDEAAAIIRSLRVHGQGDDKYDNVRVGINGRLDTIQAAILLEKLVIFADEIEARARIAARYDELLPAGLKRPVISGNATSVWAQYTLQMDGRDDVLTQLKRRGVPAAIYYARPLHRQPAYKRHPRAQAGLPVSERLAAAVLSLPMHPYLTLDEQLRIAAGLRLNELLMSDPDERYGYSSSGRSG